jgi:hypothetical protein
MENVILPKIHEHQKEYITESENIPKARLIMDGHSTRRQRMLWKKAFDLGIDVHILPAHTSHLIQPLDRSVFANMKRYVINNII